MHDAESPLLELVLDVLELFLLSFSLLAAFLLNLAPMDCLDLPLAVAPRTAFWWIVTQTFCLMLKHSSNGRGKLGSLDSGASCLDHRRWSNSNTTFAKPTSLVTGNQHYYGICWLPIILRACAVALVKPWSLVSECRMLLHPDDQLCFFFSRLSGP